MVDTRAGLKCWQSSTLYGGLAELVDASDLGSDAFMRVGSSPMSPTCCFNTGRTRRT